MEALVNSGKSNGFAAQDKRKTVETGSTGGTGNTPTPLKIPLVPKLPVVLISDKTRYIKSIVSISRCPGGHSKLTPSNAGLHFSEMRPFLLWNISENIRPRGLLRYQTEAKLHLKQKLFSNEADSIALCTWMPFS